MSCLIHRIFVVESALLLVVAYGAKFLRLFVPQYWSQSGGVRPREWRWGVHESGNSLALRPERELRPLSACDRQSSQRYGNLPPRRRCGASWLRRSGHVERLLESRHAQSAGSFEERGIRRGTGLFRRPGSGQHNRAVQDSDPARSRGLKPLLPQWRKLQLQDVVQFYINSSQLARQGLLRNAPAEFKNMSLSSDDLNALVAFPVLAHGRLRRRVVQEL